MAYRWKAAGQREEYTFDVNEETWKIVRECGRKMTILLILVEIFTVIMQRNVCEKAFDRKQAGTAVQVTAWAAFYIISNATTYFFELPSWLNMVIFSVSFLAF